MIVFSVVIIFIFGLVIGSFLNVCIYRIPKGESIVFPASHCTACGHKLGPIDLVPLFSQLILKSKCRYCGKPISMRYFNVELITGLLFLATFIRFIYYEKFPMFFIEYLILNSLLVAVTFIDIDHKIIPDKITYPGMAIGIIFGILQGNIWNSIIGLLVGGGLFYFIAVASKGGMGGGDVKLAALLGAFFGWKLILLNSFFSFLLGGIVATILLLLKLKGRKDYIPFGPYLAIAAMITIFWGDQILKWYTHLRLF